MKTMSNLNIYDGAEILQIKSTNLSEMTSINV